MTRSALDFIEIAIIAGTLLATVAIAWRVWRQTRDHFQLEHSRSFIERFNSAEMVAVRREVDEWLATGEAPAALTARVSVGGPGARTTSVALRTLSNFFQELGVAYRHEAVKRDYTWDVFGALSARYWWSLEPYVTATRERLGRPTLHCDFEAFAEGMKRSDRRRGVETTPAPPAGAPAAWIFGYGSLLHPESIERTLEDPLDRSKLQTTWLNGYRRGWTVWDEVEFVEDPPGRTPLVYLGLTPDPGARCNGVLFPVALAELDAFDARERSYVRQDVTSEVDASLGAPVYTYVGKPEFARFPTDARVAQRYVDLVGAALDLWGTDFRAGYNASTGTTAVELITGEYGATQHAPGPVPE